MEEERRRTAVTVYELDERLFRCTPSELRHLQEAQPTLSKRYLAIPKVTYGGREMYLFHFTSLMEDRHVCVNKESRFTYIPEHIHTVIELVYVYAGECTQVIDGRRLTMSQGDICLLDSNVPHSLEYLDRGDIVIAIEMQREYLTRGFLQRLGNNGIINGFLINALSLTAAHDQYLLFRKQAENPIHSIVQHLLCEYYAPQICSDKMVDAYMVLLFCEILRQYRNQAFSNLPNVRWRIVDILEYIENNYLTATLQSTARHFGFQPNYLSSCIKKETGRTFKELLILQRMYQASFYLTNTEMPVYEIAVKVGYENLGFFYKKFEEIYKCKPAAYRSGQAERRGRELKKS